MTSRKSNLIKYFLVLGLCGILPINIANANFWDKYIGNKFIGKWCISRVVSLLGEYKVPSKDRYKNCLTFKRGGELVYILETTSGKSSYEILDKENILIIPPNGNQGSMKYDKNNEELKIVGNFLGEDPFGYSETYLTKE
tara:strand:- start:59 stop:478 length:420 start_codon:yes stop_codon:yes gene_type:complete